MIWEIFIHQQKLKLRALNISVLEDNYYFSSKIASTSTETPSGKLFVLTAALVWVPASPKIEAIKSEAPFITLGWSIKSSVELTNPVNFIQDLTFDKSSPQAFLTWATILKPHLSAALYPASISKFFPTLPLIKAPFLSMEIWPDIYSNLPVIFDAT